MPAPEGFDYDVRGGEVVISHHGRRATVLRGTASVGLAVARLFEGDVGARTALLAASDVGLRHRLDDLATAPMSNLCQLDVEQGRFADAEKSLADALRSALA